MYQGYLSDEDITEMEAEVQDSILSDAEGCSDAPEHDGLIGGFDYAESFKTLTIHERTAL